MTAYIYASLSIFLSLSLIVCLRKFKSTQVRLKEDVVEQLGLNRSS